MIRTFLRVFLGLGVVLGMAVPPAAARQESQSGQESRQPPPGEKDGETPTGVPLPEGYVIGPEDVLSVVVWREKEMSGDVVVRPDGKISLPLLNDIHAAGLTPEQLAVVVEKEAMKYVQDSDASVIVKEIRSRKVFVIGEVGKPGVFPLTSEVTVLELIAAVGGLNEYANKSNIQIVRKEGGGERRMRFNYNDVIRGRNLEQNIKLEPGDLVIVR